MKKENKTKKTTPVEEEMEIVSEEEQEVIDSYMDEEIENHMKQKEKKELKLRKANEKILKEEIDDKDLEEFEIEDDFKEIKKDPAKDMEKKTKIRKFLNILFVVIVVVILLAVIDIICVSKFQKGPFFAIPIHTYDDGGTKEYYGLGYKVIKYNQVQGRRDMEIGTWALKYNVEPIYTEIVDLAIAFTDNADEAYKKYNKQLLVVTGSLKEVDPENSTITLSYEDDGGKYNLDVVCDMSVDRENLTILEPKYEISAMGTMVKYESRVSDKPATIYLNNCFAQQ